MINSETVGTIIEIDTAKNLKHHGNPKTIKVEVIAERQSSFYVAIQDEKTPGGKRLWANTDTFGSTVSIDKKQLKKSQ